MNPLADWFVEVEAVANRQQQLFDWVGYRPHRPGATDVPRSSRSRAWRRAVAVEITRRTRAGLVRPWIRST